MQPDPGLIQDAEHLVLMLRDRSGLAGVFARVRGGSLEVGVEPLDGPGKTYWRAESQGGGFFELQIAVGPGKFETLTECPTLEDLAEAITRSWAAYRKKGRLA